MISFSPQKVDVFFGFLNFKNEFSPENFTLKEGNSKYLY